MLKKIKSEDLTAGKMMFLKGHSLTEVCNAYPQYSRNQWRTIKKNHNWENDKELHLTSLHKSAFKMLQQSEKQFALSLIVLTGQVNEKIQMGGIKLETMSDIEKLMKLVHFYVENGVEKNEVQNGAQEHLSPEQKTQIWRILRDSATTNTMKQLQKPISSDR